MRDILSVSDRRRPTRVEALPAFLWAAVIMANQTAKMHILINPTFQSMCLGNILQLTAARCTPENAAAGVTAQSLVEKVREAIVKVTDEYMRKVEAQVGFLKALTTQVQKIAAYGDAIKPLVNLSIPSITLPTSDRPVTCSPPSAPPPTSHSASVPWRMLPRHFEGKGGFNFFRKFTICESQCVLRIGFTGRVALITAAHKNAESASTRDGRREHYLGDVGNRRREHCGDVHDETAGGISGSFPPVDCSQDVIQSDHPTTVRHPVPSAERHRSSTAPEPGHLNS
nr:vinorine synthase-like [Ipomoea batatas]